MHARLHHIDTETPNISTFWFQPDTPMRYIAGQFTELRLPHNNMDERGDKRWFTLSSSPTDQMVSITTRLDPERPSSFKRNLFGLNPGAEVTLAEAMGDFVLPKDPARPLVFVAGGIGVTPMHSMVKWLVDAGEVRDIHMFYAARQADDVAFREVFESAPINFSLLLTDPPKGWDGPSGELDAQMIADLPGAQQTALVYLAGPEPMVEKFYAQLPHFGVDKSRLVTDYFPGYTRV